MVARTFSMDVESFVQEALRDRKQLVPCALVQLHDSQMVCTSEIRLIPLRAPGSPASVILQSLLESFEVQLRCLRPSRCVEICVAVGD